MKHETPWSVAIEPVYGCNMRCNFCGIHTATPEPHKLNFMDFSTLEKISLEIGSWLVKKRVEITARGEALLHPNIIEMIKVLRKNAPKCQFQLTTNGLELLRDPTLPLQLFDAGLNILLVDAYNYEDELISIGKSLKRKGIIYSDYYTDKSVNPYSFSSDKIKAYVLMGDLKANNKTRVTRKIINVAGNVNYKKAGLFPLNAPLQKKCSRPFRELVIHWDGVVPVCCIDWKHEYPIGRFPEHSLKEIWESLPFQYSRFLLFNKNRKLRPCYRCDYGGGFRLGFLECPKIEESHASILTNMVEFLEGMKKYNHSKARDSVLYTRKSFFKRRTQCEK